MSVAVTANRLHLSQSDLFNRACTRHPIDLDYSWLQVRSFPFRAEIDDRGWTADGDWLTCFLPAVFFFESRIKCDSDSLTMEKCRSTVHCSLCRDR